jgi:hypothetical protein
MGPTLEMVRGGKPTADTVSKFNAWRTGELSKSTFTKTVERLKNLVTLDGWNTDLEVMANDLDNFMADKYLIKQEMHLWDFLKSKIFGGNRTNPLCDLRNCAATSDLMVLMSKGVLKDNSMVWGDYVDEYMDQMGEVAKSGKYTKKQISDLVREYGGSEDICHKWSSGGDILNELSNTGNKNITAAVRALERSALDANGRVDYSAAEFKDTKENKVIDAGKSKINGLPELFRARLSTSGGLYSSLLGQKPIVGHVVSVYFNPYRNQMMVLDPLPGSGGPYANGSSNTLYGTMTIMPESYQRLFMR